MIYNVQKYEIKEFSLVYIIICLIYFVELKKIAIFYPCILGKYPPDRPQGCNFFLYCQVFKGQPFFYGSQSIYFIWNVILVFNYLLSVCDYVIFSNFEYNTE